MTLALLALLAALLITLAGNAASLAGRVAERIGAGLPLLIPALAGPAIVIGLMFAAGAAMVPVLGHDLDRVLAAASLALTSVLVLRPNQLPDPGEPTRSAFAIGAVIAAFSIRDGIAPLAFSIGLLAGDTATAALGLLAGTGAAMALATRGLPLVGRLYARYLAAILLAVGAAYIGVFSI